MEDKAQYGKRTIEEVRYAKFLMERKIGEAVEKFQERTGLGIKHIDIEFVDTSNIGGKHETCISGVKVTLEDL